MSTIAEGKDKVIDSLPFIREALQLSTGAKIAIGRETVTVTINVDTHALVAKTLGAAVKGDAK
jgi:hypothetical protein